MSADPILIEDRIIQRRGVIQLNSNWVRISPLFILCDLVVIPKNNYRSFNYQPSKGRWSNINLLHQQRVIESKSQEYSNQQIQFLDYGIRQDIEFMRCSEGNLLGGLVSIGATQTPPVTISPLTSFENSLSTYPEQFGDLFLISTYYDARIRFRLYAMPAYVCAPIPVPSAVPSIPLPDAPLNEDDPAKDVIFPVSAPYTPPDDNGFTYIPPTTPSNSGTWSWTFKGSASATVFSGSAPGFSDDNPGILEEPNGSCLDGTLYSLYSITRGVRYAPGNLSLSTCGSGAMIVLTQTFTPD